MIDRKTSLKMESESIGEQKYFERVAKRCDALMLVERGKVRFSFVVVKIEKYN